jgi:CRP-like cAMP-binding protein
MQRPEDRTEETIYMITSRRYESGEVILREGDTGETAYIIDHGQVEVTKQLDGRAVHLAYIGAGDVFGEMSMIDDRPRSATITAVEPTVVREVHREGFYDGLQSHPEVALNLLKVLFERLREAHATILQLQRGIMLPSVAALAAIQVPAASAAGNLSLVHPVVHLTGLTERASMSLPSTPFRVNTFPFRIGRKSDDPLVHNDLMLEDFAPLQISRHHVSLIKENGRIGVVDRGSTLGGFVDDQHIGGQESNPGPVFFTGRIGTLVLGNIESPFRYEVAIDQAMH